MKLREIYLHGYKSIGTEQNMPLGDVTVLLGANGAGKSNVVSFFSMFTSLLNEKLSTYVNKHGADRLLFYGKKETDLIRYELVFESEGRNYSYSAFLEFGIPDRLFVRDEQILYPYQRSDCKTYALSGENGETGICKDQREPCLAVQQFLSRIGTYQFHDTSETAKIKDRVYVDDARSLHHDGGNLAAFLRMLQTAYPKHYERIVRRIQTVMPQFGWFDLEPLPGNKEYVRLNWYDTSGTLYLLDPHQISDGSLRFMALAALLLQPKELLPSLIVLDEPELGLHPAAIAELAGMVRIASQNTQVLLATQSTRLVDEFELENIVVVERNPHSDNTEFKKLDAPQLEEWLERYSLSELWEKNVLGGQP